MKYSLLLKGIVDDAFIVPVAISYEKLIDGSFVGEQLGKPKVMESFGLAAKSIWSTLHSNFGSVRVDFCQPFSLKDYLHNAAFNIYNYNSPILKTINNHNPDDCNQRQCVACSGDYPFV
jgi:glycerol-3-phosphate O-acyltransferase